MAELLPPQVVIPPPAPTVVAAPAVSLPCPSSNPPSERNSRRSAHACSVASSTPSSGFGKAPSPVSSVRIGRQSARSSVRMKRFSIVPPRRSPRRSGFVETNGWQVKLMRVAERVGALFHSWTMSDVVFVVGNADSEVQEFPAHRFILGASSPVFYQYFFSSKPGPGAEANSLFRAWQLNVISKPSGVEDFLQLKGVQPSLPFASPQLPLKISIEEVSPDSFAEFLRFLYTDEVNIDSTNVAALHYLADRFKVGGLADLCLKFLRRELDGKTALRFLQVGKRMSVKAMLFFWRDLVEERQAMIKRVQRYRELTAAEQRSLTIALSKRRPSSSAPLSSFKGNASRMTSTVPSENLSEWAGQSNRRGTRADSVGSVAESIHSYASSVTEFFAQEYDDAHVKLRGHGLLNTEEERASYSVAHTFLKLARQSCKEQLLVAEELALDCWKCIRSYTLDVLRCDEWLDQDIKTLQTVLGMDICSVEEIDLFRAMNQWATHRCEFHGLAPSAENKRSVLGDETIQLIRFPVMTLQEVQWEVLPTGLLVHEDVAQVQKAIMKKKEAGIGRFVAQPRAKLTMLQKKAGGRLAVITRGNTLAGDWDFDDDDNLPLSPKTSPRSHRPSVYTAASRYDPDAAMDKTLAGLLHRHLLFNRVQSMIAKENESVALGEAETAGTLALANESAHGRRLPPVSAALQMTRESPMLLASPRRSPATPSIPQLIAQQLPFQDERKKNGLPLKEPSPEDFKHVGVGLYVFRGDRLVELQLQQSELMIRELGSAGDALFQQDVLNRANSRASDHGDLDAEVRMTVVAGLRSRAAEAWIPMASWLQQQQ